MRGKHEGHLSMNVTDDVRAAQVPELFVGHLTLLRRLMVMCPATGRPTDTGFELAAVPSNPRRRQLLVDCLECGQDHEWHLEDSFLS